MEGFGGMFPKSFIAAFLAKVGLAKRSMVVNANGDGDRLTTTGICTSFSSSAGRGFNVQLIAIARV